MSTLEGYHDYYGKVIKKTIEFVWKTWSTEHPPVYSMISPGVLHRHHAGW